MDVTMLGAGIRIERIAEGDFWTSTEFWLVAVTIGLVLVTGGLWWATTRLVAEAKKTAKMQLRAYVTIDKVFGHTLAVGSPPLFKVHLSNRGQTPAHSATVSATAVLTGDPLKEPFPQQIPKIEFGSIAPGQPMVLTPNPSIRLGQNSLTDIGQGRAVLLVVGRVEYVDVFGTPQWVDFRFQQSSSWTVATPIDQVPHGNSFS